MIVPWLTPIVESVEVAGVKLSFKALEAAKGKADEAGLLSPIEEVEYPKYSFQSIAKEDPNLALAALRLEIEKRLNLLAETQGLSIRGNKGIGSLMKSLQREGIITNEQQSVLADMIGLLNGAVHGAKVDERAAEWAVEVGPRLLQSLDNRIDSKAPIR